MNRPFRGSAGGGPHLVSFSSAHTPDEKDDVIVLGLPTAVEFRWLFEGKKPRLCTRPLDIFLVRKLGAPGA